jgi:hypothetical protein
MNISSFTFESIESQYRVALDQGYEFLTCADYVRCNKSELPSKAVVNRVDIDVSVPRAERLGDVYNRLGIKATFFVRLHANEYNPSSFENYRILKSLVHAGHEIGYHSEIVDAAAIWGETAEACLRRDIAVINGMLDIEICGVASHGGMTGLNNLDFWEDRIPAEFGLLYEAYDRQTEFNLFHQSFYISDSEWTRWKCYDNGQLVEGNRKSFGEHVLDGHPLIYLLVHPDTYFDRHIYE